ncbi:uracil-DNA glycosylase [Mollicutes bacterium LVI A0039]|nr:uracil-DNA glycosylase [Mollicutes bacterium LVI A0039]
MEKVINDWHLDIDDQLVEFIDHEYQNKEIAPPRELLFRALELTSVQDVKVVIFGQDPYPTKGVATGLAFSSNGTLPASLRNMFKELYTDLNIIRTNTNLEDWAAQGVLLLNTSLTVEVGNAGSHSKIGWIDVTNQVIKQINDLHRSVVFVLLGTHAQKLSTSIDSKHVILKFTHPSPLSAYRGFWDCKMYSQINTNLLNHGYAPIDFGDSENIFQ